MADKEITYERLVARHRALMPTNHIDSNGRVNIDYVRALGALVRDIRTLEERTNKQSLVLSTNEESPKL